MFTSYLGVSSKTVRITIILHKTSIMSYMFVHLLDVAMKTLSSVSELQGQEKAAYTTANRQY